MNILIKHALPVGSACNPFYIIHAMQIYRKENYAFGHSAELCMRWYAQFIYKKNLPTFSDHWAELRQLPEYKHCRSHRRIHSIRVAEFDQCRSDIVKRFPQITKSQEVGIVRQQVCVAPDFIRAPGTGLMNQSFQLTLLIAEFQMDWATWAPAQNWHIWIYRATKSKMWKSWNHWKTSKNFKC